ncbi:hypothetical protein DL93DRAFT_1107002 [Clavulina sp. PMI_390]|nr:hypothetical protein DL93DRAFT_1107002 [Clavulina sp. PMI_390]
MPMPLFGPKPEPITYSFSSNDARTVTITNPQTNVIYWVERPSGGWLLPIYLWKPASTRDDPMSRTLVAKIEYYGYNDKDITYNGVKMNIRALFPWALSQPPRGVLATSLIDTPAGNYAWSMKLELLDPIGQVVGRYKTNKYLFRKSPGPTLTLKPEASNLNIDLIILGCIVMQQHKHDHDQIGESISDEEE